MHTSAPLVGIDFDGTIADTSAFKQKWLYERFGVSVPLGQCNRSGMLAAGLSDDHYNEMLLVACDKEHTLAAEACPGAILGVHELSEVAELCLITDRGEFGNWLKWCQLWLEQKSIQNLLKRAFSTQWALGRGSQVSKQRICRENSVTVLVDDDPQNLKGLKDTKPILYLRDNDDVIPEITGVEKAFGWPQIVPLCRRLLA